MTLAAPSKPPVRRTRRRVLLTTLALALLAGSGFVGWLFYQNAVNERLLRAALAETDALDSYWRIEDIEARRAVVPDPENSAHRIGRIRPRLDPLNWSEVHRREHALSGLAPQVRLTDEQYREVIDWFEEVEGAVRPALALARYPRGRYPIAYALDGVSTLLPYVDEIRQVQERVVRPLLLILIHEGDLAAAMTACHANLNLGRSLGDEPFFITQMVRVRLHRETVRALERVLGQGEVSAEALAKFQQALAEDLAFDAWTVGVRGERAIVQQIMEALQKKLLKPSLLRALSTEGPRPPRTPLDRAREWLDDAVGIETRPDHAWLLRQCNRLLDLAPLPWPERRRAVESLVAEWDRGDAPELARQVLNFVPAWCRALWRAQARGQCAVAVVAAERYRQRHGRWPEALAALVPDFLPAVPLDPFDGQSLRYQRLADGVAIYSVGEDGTDDGGRLADQNPPSLFARTSASTDLGFRLWDVRHRGQLPTHSNADQPKGP